MFSSETYQNALGKLFMLSLGQFVYVMSSQAAIAWDKGALVLLTLVALIPHLISLWVIFRYLDFCIEDRENPTFLKPAKP